MNRQKATQRPAFTLVEVLIVIAIIGVLMGLTVTAVNFGRKSIQQQAIALEVSTLAQSIEAYKLKYGGYPPDGSSFESFKSHFRAAFPNILQSEFDALSAGRLPDGTGQVASTTAVGGIMDPAEALVFCLGGFSTNPSKPFTGQGGPLSEIMQSPNTPYNPRRFQYNASRNEPLFPFPEGTLSIAQNATSTFSNDEQTFGTGAADLLPVYVPKNRAMPIVYFSSSTYSTNTYAGSQVAGVAKPYKSEKRNTSVTYTASTAERYFPFMNDKTFQIISAGLDDDFGGNDLLGNPLHYYTFPSGNRINIAAGTGALENPLAILYQPTSGGISTQLDNATNFSEGTLEGRLP